jgi:transposase
MPRQYPPEFRQRALRLLDTLLEASEVSEFEAIKSVASKLGIAEESVRRWRRKTQVDAGERPGATSSEHAEIRRLKRENAELRRANEILKSASAFFAAEFDRPATK